jgi:protein gp37
MGSIAEAASRRLSWAYEVYRRCRDAGIPFLFKQASDLYTERGSMALRGISRSSI